MSEPMSNEELHARLGELTERTLSSTSRVGHMVMTIVAAVIAAGLAGLLMSDLQLYPILMPMSGIVSLWCMFAVACAWVVFGVFLLLRRRPLFPSHEVVAAMIAMAFAAMITGGSLGATMARSDSGMTSIHHLTGATQLGIVMMIMAIVVWVRALLRHSRLQAMRERLERELSES